MDKTTLVTGASGFLGQAIMLRLAVLGRRAIGLDPKPGPAVQVNDDLSDSARLRALITR